MTGDVLVGILPFARSCPGCTWGNGFGCEGSKASIMGDVSGLQPGGISTGGDPSQGSSASLARRTWSAPYVEINLEIASSMKGGGHRLAHRAGRERDEVLTVVDLDLVVEPDVAARGLTVHEPGEVVRQRGAGLLADLAAGYRTGVEHDGLVGTVDLNDDVDRVGMRMGSVSGSSSGLL